MDRLPIYLETNITTKTGLNFVRNMFEGNGSLFQRVDQENDLGIDATVELLGGRTTLHQHLALQIKSGESYYNEQTRECSIPIGKHRDYWQRYPLPVLGIVYVPSQNVAYWIDIKDYLRRHQEATVIHYRTSHINCLTSSTFKEVFLASWQSKPPRFSEDVSFELANSPDSTERDMGLDALFYWYGDHVTVWNFFFDLFDSQPDGRTQAQAAEYISWGPTDPFGSPGPTELILELRRLVAKKIGSFGETEIRKLFRCAGEVPSTNGEMNKSIVDLIVSLPSAISVLTKIVADTNESYDDRLSAAFILAVDQGEEALPVLQHLAEDQFIDELIEFIEVNGNYNPYYS